jgi:hypothetical protein
MRYYHDAAGKTVYAVPDAPEVHPSHDKRGRYSGCRVWVSYEAIPGDNYIDPKSRQWAKPIHPVRHEDYGNRDSPERASDWFRQQHMTGFGAAITESEYNALKQQYERAAAANQPPASS